MPFENSLHPHCLPFVTAAAHRCCVLTSARNEITHSRSSHPFKARVSSSAFQSIFYRYVACLASHLATLLPTSVRSRYFADPLSTNQSSFSRSQPSSIRTFRSRFSVVCVFLPNLNNFLQKFGEFLIRK